MASATALAITLNDAKVLNAIFDSEATLASPQPISTTIPTLPGVDEAEYEICHAEQAEALRAIDTPNPSVDVVQAVIDKFSHILSKQQRFAPAYANRAQATRLLIEGDDILQQSNDKFLASIIFDLRLAINHASPSLATEPLSPARAHILANSHTHLAYLFLLASRVDDPQSLPPSLKASIGNSAEEMASYHFRLGGSYGNKIAQEMAVKTNPYAKLCGEMVKQALKEEMDVFGA